MAMLKTNNPLLAQITMNPLLVAEGAEELFQTCLQHVVSHEKAAELVNTAVSASADDDFWGDPNDPDDWMHYFRPYEVKDGILQIPVMGVLLSRFPWQLGRWATGYKYIEMAFRRGLADPNVRGIAMIIDSPGGEVTECFELTDKIYGWRGEKPIRSFAANHAYSAAYSTYSAGDPDTRMVTRSGGVGSIGVVTAHIEYSDYLKNEGIKVTFIYAGKHKVDGNPYEKLSASAKARTQARIDKIYGVFVSTVARNTGIDEAEIRATEALTYDADEAIEVGLADRIGALDEELVVYATELADTGDEFMAGTQGNVTGQKPEGGDDKATFTQEQLDAAVAKATTDGAAAERARYTEIMGCDAAKTRPAAAAMFVELGTDAATAQAQLAKLPEEKAATAPERKTEATNPVTGKPEATNRNHFEEHMNSSKQPNIAANVEGEGSGGEDEDQANSILAAYGKAAGIKRKSA